MFNLPYEMLSNICDYLDNLKDLSKLSKTNKDINESTFKCNMFWNAQGHERIGSQRWNESKIEAPLIKFQFFFKQWEEQARSILKKHRRGSAFDGIFNTSDDSMKEKEIVEELIETEVENQGLINQKEIILNHIETKLFNH